MSHSSDEENVKEVVNSKSSILSKISFGTSEPTQNDINSYFYLEDYTKFLNYNIEDDPQLMIDRISHHFTKTSSLSSTFDVRKSSSATQKDGSEKPPQKKKTKTSSLVNVDSVLMKELPPSMLIQENSYLLEKERKEKKKSHHEDSEKEPNILMYLRNPNGRPVTSIFNTQTKTPSNFTQFVSQYKVTDETLQTYITTEYVTIINLENCSHLSPDIIKSIGEYCPNIKVLNLERCSQVTDDHLIEMVAKGCKNLICLNLSQIPSITDRSLKVVFVNCRYLKYFSIHSNDNINGKSFQFFDYSYPTSSNQKQDDDDSEQDEEEDQEEDEEDIIDDPEEGNNNNDNNDECNKNMSNLELLDISFCGNLTSLGFMCISEFCPHLKYVNFNSTNLDDESFLNIVQNCSTKLRTLRISNCKNLTMSSFSKFHEYVPNLKVLEVTGICHNFLEFHEMEEDHVSQTQKRGRRFRSKNRQLKNMKKKMHEHQLQMQEKYESESKLLEDERREKYGTKCVLDDDICVNISSHMKSLEYLGISGSGIGAKGVNSITRFLRHLKVLELSHTHSLDFESLRDLVADLEDLHTLVLNESNITDQQIEELRITAKENSGGISSSLSESQLDLGMSSSTTKLSATRNRGSGGCRIIKSLGCQTLNQEYQNSFLSKRKRRILMKKNRRKNRKLKKNQFDEENFQYFTLKVKDPKEDEQNVKERRRR